VSIGVLCKGSVVEWICGGLVVGRVFGGSKSVGQGMSSCAHQRYLLEMYPAVELHCFSIEEVLWNRTEKVVWPSKKAPAIKICDRSFDRPTFVIIVSVLLWGALDSPNN